MPALPPDLDRRCQTLERDLAFGSAALGARLPDFLSAADALRRAGAGRRALGMLEPLEKVGALHAGYHFTRALCFREVQDLEAAYEAVRKAKHLAPKNADIAFAAAQFAFETWRPSIALFRDAQKLAPRNATLLRNHAIALSQEGRTQQGADLLLEQIASTPGWIDGHRQLASIRQTAGLPDVDAGFEAACRAEPGNLPLRLAWFHFLCQARHWDRAGDVLQSAHADYGAELALKYSEIYFRAETGGSLTQDDLFGAHTSRHDPGFDLCRTRYLLRKGDADRAHAIAAQHIGLQSASAFWPYLSLCWRVMGDARFDWLERGGELIAEVDCTGCGVDLTKLAAAVKSLHTMKQPYAEQSVRGGTQTGRSVLFHHDPLIQTFRRAITEQVARYISEMPALEPDHPFLLSRPEDVRLTGSWSVALGKEGYHAAHTHVMGWLSSAIYLAVPDGAALGAPPSGYLCFGEPPPELGLNLAAYRHVAPKIGKLALFPSFTWHGTEPFRAGERLSIAFDVAPGP